MNAMRKDHQLTHLSVLTRQPGRHVRLCRGHLNADNFRSPHQLYPQNKTRLAYLSSRHRIGQFTGMRITTG
jgi:hypothetical protein